jgi:hypothetical protein
MIIDVLRKLAAALPLTSLALVELVATVPTTQAAVVQPNKVAIVVFENLSYSRLLGAQGCGANPKPDPYICANLHHTPGIIDLTNMHESPPTGTNTHSAAYYAIMTSGDDCGGKISNKRWERPGAPALTAGPPDNCGTNVFAQMDTVGTDWRSYQEYFQPGVTSCNANLSDTGSTWDSGNSYARKHNPARFYADLNTDCTSSASTSKVVNFPTITNSGDMADINTIGHPFQGVTLPRFSFITPSMCHGMHNSQAHCVKKGFNAWGHDAQGIPIDDQHWGSQHPPQTDSGRVRAGDYFLERNFQDIRNAVGPQGVVIVTWDEGDTDAITNEQLATFIVPGTGATLAPCDSTCLDIYYDHASTVRAIVDTFGLSCSQFNSVGSRKCSAAKPLPIKLKTLPSVTGFTPTSGTAGASVTVSGMNLSEVTLVTFGGTSALFTVNSSTSITATIPSGATTGPVCVTDPDGTGCSALNFPVPLRDGRGGHKPIALDG